MFKRFYLPDENRKRPVKASSDADQQLTEKVRKMKSIYVGNLPYSATEDEIRELFGSHGEVKLVKLVIDRETNRPKGFGFVEMDDAAVAGAIQALDGQEFGGRRLRVNEARERAERPQHSFGDRPQRRFDGPRGNGGFRPRNDRPQRSSEF